MRRTRTQPHLGHRAAVLAAVVVGALLTPAPTAAQAPADPYWEPQVVSVWGDHQALVGDFNGDESDDVLWYSPGEALDRLWIGRKDRRDPNAFWTFGENISNRYEPFVGDFAGDDADDIFWYAPGPAADVIWVGAHGAAASFGIRFVDQRGTFQPLVLHDRTGGKDDIFWYAPGPAPDELWIEHDSDAPPEHRLAARVDGTYRPFVGDWDGDGFEEPFWYAPGPAPDYEWRARPDGTFRSIPRQIAGTYQPVTRDHLIYDGKTYDDIVWVGATKSSVWHNVAGHFTTEPLAGWPGRVTAIESSGASGFDVALWGRPGVERGIDVEAVDNGLLPLSPSGLPVDAEGLAVGDFDADGCSDLLWWTPGAAADSVWYCRPLDLG